MIGKTIISESVKEPIECSNGLVICGGCKKCVPKTLLCIYCGTPIMFKHTLITPSLKPLEMKILTVLQSVQDELKVSQISDKTEISRESIRVYLSNMLRFGFVNKAGRGKYTISKIGEAKLKEYLKGDNI